MKKVENTNCQFIGLIFETAEVNFLVSDNDKGDLR